MATELLNITIKVTVNVKRGDIINSAGALAAATDFPQWIVVGDTNAGRPAPVAAYGIAKARSGGAVTKGKPVGVGATAGKLVEKTPHTHVENKAASYTQNAVTDPASDVFIAGIALEDASGADKLFDVLVLPGRI